MREELTLEELCAIRDRYPKAVDSLYGKYVTAVIACNAVMHAIQDLETHFGSTGRYKSLAATHAENAKLWLHAYADALDPVHSQQFITLLERTQAEPCICGPGLMINGECDFCGREDKKKEGS